MEPNSITIRQIKERVTARAVCYRDDIIITDHVEQLALFRHPCRISATLALVCLHGEMAFSINLTHHRMTAGMMVVAFEGDIVQIHRAEALEAHAVLLSPDFQNDLQIDFRMRTGFYLHTRQHRVVRIPQAELEGMALYYPLLKLNIETERPERTEIIRGLVRAFSCTVISVMQQYSRSNEETADEMAPRSRRLFDKFMALLRVHHSTQRGVKFYAGRLCLTPNYLSGVIKAFSGKSATEWINEYVVLEAKIMLQNPELSIQEIAYRLHFPTQSAFGKYFKLQTGMGPKAYRKGLWP